MRLFVAIELPRRVREALWNEARKLGKNWRSGRLLPPESYHITLSFLGQQPEHRLESITAAMDRCHCPPFQATLGELGLFDQRGGGVLWRGVWSPELSRLQSQLARQLEQAGFALEKRPFQPHITLARRMALDLETDLAALTVSAQSFGVEEMVLMRSRLSQQGASYQGLYRSSFRRTQ